LGKESKLIRSDETDLLDTIADKCNSNEHSPIFVSEGTSVAKRHAIGRSAYLGYVYEKVLPRLGNTVVYGVSFDPKDDHILQAMSSSPPQHMAVSVFSGATAAEQQEYCQRVEYQIHRRCPRTEITFFQSDGPGCWCNPTD
jgi:phosphoheptose isomerase